ANAARIGWPSAAGNEISLVVIGLNHLRGGRQGLTPAPSGSDADGDAKWRGRHFAKTFIGKTKPSALFRRLCFSFGLGVSCCSCDGLLLRRSWSRFYRPARSPSVA